MPLVDDWPLFALRVRTPRLELRPALDEDLEALLELIEGGVHQPGAHPFDRDWSTTGTPAEVRRSSLQFCWRMRAELQPTSWHVQLAVLEGGIVCGVQSLYADDFAVRRVACTGSWLGLAHHGRGIGTEMRQAALHLAFAGLGAERCESGAYLDNPASLAVSRHCGYEANGEQVNHRSDGPAVLQRLVLRRESWERRRRDDIETDGLGPCLTLLGAG